MWWQQYKDGAVKAYQAVNGWDRHVHCAADRVYTCNCTQCARWPRRHMQRANVHRARPGKYSPIQQSAKVVRGTTGYSYDYIYGSGPLTNGLEMSTFEDNMGLEMG